MTSLCTGWPSFLFLPFKTMINCIRKCKSLRQLDVLVARPSLAYWICGKLFSSVRLLAPAGLEGLIRKEALFLWCFSDAARFFQGSCVCYAMSDVMILTSFIIPVQYCNKGNLEEDCVLSLYVVKGSINIAPFSLLWKFIG